MKVTENSGCAKGRNSIREGGSPQAICELTELEVLSAAEEILRQKMVRLGTLTCPTASSEFLRMRLGHLPHEEFHAVWLDNRHRVLAVERLFVGTIDGSSVYARELVRSALKHNAAAVIFAHNHPSGVVEPSSADRDITRELIDALKYVSVRVLDHIIVGAGDTLSLAQRGFM